MFTIVYYNLQLYKFSNSIPLNLKVSGQCCVLSPHRIQTSAISTPHCGAATGLSTSEAGFSLAPALPWWGSSPPPPGTTGKTRKETSTGPYRNCAALKTTIWPYLVWFGQFGFSLVWKGLVQSIHFGLSQTNKHTQKKTELNIELLRD